MRNWRLIFLGGFVCLLGCACWIGGHVVKIWARTPKAGSGSLIAVEIPPGACLRSVSESLAQVGVIERPSLFDYWVRWGMGAGGELKWGQLAFKDNMAPVDVLNVLKFGIPAIHRIEVQPGLTLDQIAALIEDSDLDVRGDFLAKASDEEFISSLGIKASSLEGYLGPGSYGLAKHLNVGTLLRVMVARRYENWGKTERERARLLRVDLHKVLTLASIIEAETSIDKEREKIASVLYNRMINNWKLCSDATAAYAEKIISGHFDGKVDRMDRLNDNPYNTWVHRDLPPGPICSPSESCIHAALWPKRTSFMYFISLPDPGKGHRFCPDLLCAIGHRHSAGH